MALIIATWEEAEMTAVILKICETCRNPIPEKSQGKRFCSRPCIRTVPLAERFWSHVDIQAPDECWLWTGALDGKGYGVITVDYKTARAHRKSYELSIGPIPTGLLICHKCDVRACVNPQHLFPGTYYDNAVDMYQKGRSNPPRHRGEKHGNAKVTEETVRLIRSDTRSTVAISRETGLSETQVSRIRKRECWQHIE
jgi:hypothetical protein